MRVEKRRIPFIIKVSHTIVAATAMSAGILVTTLPAQFKQSTLVTVPVTPVARVDAGVKVYEHDRTAFARATQLELVGAPVTFIDGAKLDPAFDLTRADDVALLSDGRIAAYSPIGTRFLVFRANGQPERKIGRNGAGPGEFMRANGLIVASGDTMVLNDAGNRRLNWVTADRGVVANKPRGNSANMRTERVVGVLSTGEIVFSSQHLVQEGVRDQVIRPLAGLVLWSRTGMARALAGVPDMETAMVLMRAPRKPYWTSAPIQFTRRAMVAAWDSVIATGSGDGYRIDVRDVRDTPLARVVVNAPRRRVTTAMREAALQSALNRVRPAPNSEEIGGEVLKQSIRDTPVADSLPPYWAFYVSPNKTLWVVDYILPTADGWSATAFRRDGTIVGRLNVKERGRPETFGDDRVVIRTEDEDGVVSLTVRRIGITTTKAK